MTDEKINSTANNIQIDIDNLSYVNYLWTQRISDTSIKGIRLDKRNLPTDTVYSSSLNSKVNKSGDTMTGNLTPATNKGASLGTSSLYWNNIYGTTIYEGGTSLANKYLGKTAKAADADKLDGHDSTYYLNYNNLANKPTIPTAGTTASAVSTTASGGSATTWSKSDHVHNISLATGDANGQVKIAGTNVSVKGLGSAAYTNSTAYATSGHTHSFSQITSRGEAFLDWGGKNFSGSYGPIDAAMVPELGANRLAFMPANAVTIEYSRDGGSTWTDYGPTDSQKINLFNGLGSSFTIGKATSGAGNIATNKYQLRVNIYTSAGHVYTVLNKFVIYLSTSGTNNNWCTIRARKQSDYTANNDKWTIFADKISVSGWSGYNVINTSGITTYGNTPSTQYGHIQFIFGCDTGSTNNSYAGLNISKIFGFGGVGWTTPSTMAKTGRMYTYDSSQNVIFPAAITSGAINSYNVVPRTNNTYNLGSSTYKWANVYATTIYENGTSLTNKYIAKSLTSTKGDMIYASAANTPARLGIGSAGQFLSIANGIPTWVNNPNTHNSHAIISGTKSDGSTQIKGSASSGDITLGDSGVTAGTYRSVTVNSKGIVVAGSQTDNDTNTWRKIQLNGTDKLGTGTNTNPLNIKAGSNMTITESNGTFTFAATDTNTDTHYTNYLQIKGNGTEAVKFTQNADKSLNLKPGSNVSISAASGEITISSTDTNTSHSHSAGVGLVGSGSAGTSGTYTYKTKLRSETALTVDSAAATTTSGRVYPVAVDKSGYLSVNVPWTNTTYTFNGAVSTIKDSNLTANRALISNGSGKVAVSDITSTELSYLDGANSNIQTQLNTLKGYFNENGYALIAVSASNDADGNEITTTYATQIDLDNTNATVSALKTKLDGIEAGANKTIIDTSLNSTSTNPVQNKAIYTALNSKADEQLPMEITTTEGDKFRTVGDAIVGINDAMLIMASEMPNYSAATSSALGLVKLGSDTVQSTAANSVTSTASRTYAVQKNSSGQLVVNVPWSATSVTIPNNLVLYNNAKYSYGESGSWEFYQKASTSNKCDIRYGTVSINKPSFYNQTITFAQPMPSVNYSVILSATISNNTASREVYLSVTSKNGDTKDTKTVNGFNCSGHMGNTNYKIVKLHYIAIYIS